MSATAPLPGQPLPLRILLDHAVGVTRRHFRAIYPAVAIPLALAAAAFPVAQGLLMGPMMTSGAPPAPAGLVGMVAGFGIALLAFIVVYVLAYGAMYVAVVNAAAGRAVSMGEAWRTVVRPEVWGTMLLSWVAFLAGFMCCILPGVYVGILFCLVMPVVVEERLFGTAALGRSASLIQYNPQKALASDPRGKAFLIVFVGTLMGYALTFVLQLPFVVAQQVYMVRQAASGQEPDPAAMMALMTWLQVPSNVLGTLAQTAVQLYIAFGIALLYFDVRGRKEGFDLEAGIARLEGGTPPAAAPE
jgi:hypothetical protein